MKFLEIKNLKKSFRSNFLFKKYQILENISLSVEEGEIYGFLGPNGAGKTTTINCILGIIFPDEGDILISGVPARKTSSRHILGFLPEHPYFYDYLTARELLAFSGALFSIPKEKLDKRIEELLKKVGLGGKENIKLRKFSKGMVQRVGLAQALINDPALLILDEPFTGLDPIGRKELRDIILSLKDSGKTIFFSSHILQDMELIVDKVGIIIAGKMKKEGKLSQLISSSVQYHEIVFSNMNQQILSNHNLKYSRLDKNFLIKVDSNHKANEIISIIGQHNGTIVSVTPFKKTLEDIFMTEVGR